MARRWETHELPVLRAIEEREPVSGMETLIEAVSDSLSQEDVEETVRRLLDADYISGSDAEPQ